MSQQADLSAITSPEVSGFIHAGGVLKDGSIQQQNPGYLRTVSGPKGDGLKTFLQVSIKTVQYVFSYSVYDKCEYILNNNIHYT